MQLVCLFALLMLLYHSPPLKKMENIPLFREHMETLKRNNNEINIFWNKVESWALHIFKLYNITSWKAGMKDSYFTDEKPKLRWATKKTSWLVEGLKSSKTHAHPSSFRSTWFFVQWLKTMAEIFFWGKRRKKEN